MMRIPDMFFVLMHRELQFGLRDIAPHAFLPLVQLHCRSDLCTAESSSP
jgi:hypothetical protein